MLRAVTLFYRRRYYPHFYVIVDHGGSYYGLVVVAVKHLKILIDKANDLDHKKSDVGKL